MNPRIATELTAAHAARAAGHEGRARVCARRAAGWAIHELYQQPGDAFRQLQRLQADARLPVDLRQAAERLTTKVNHDHALPFDNDLLADARAIVTFCAERLAV